jgi:hypothetical protein
VVVVDHHHLMAMDLVLQAVLVEVVDLQQEKQERQIKDTQEDQDQ